MAHLTAGARGVRQAGGQPCRQAARSAERSGMPGWRWSRVAERHDGDRLPRRQACDGCQEPRSDLAVSGLPAGGGWHRDLLIVQQLGPGRLPGPQLCADRDGGGGSSLRCDYPDGNPHVPGSEAGDGSRLHKLDTGGPSKAPEGRHAPSRGATRLGVRHRRELVAKALAPEAVNGAAGSGSLGHCARRARPR
jgi:hypothetical protein